MLLCSAAAGMAAELPAEPSTFLYEIPGSAAASISESGLSSKSGWTLLEEDDITHALQGTAVVLNDKIVAVLRPGQTELEVYSRQTDGVRLCARLQPVCQGKVAAQRTSLSIKENSRSSVTLQLNLAGAADARITYELAAGAPFIATTASPAIQKLRLQAPCRFALLPDFFGDDMLVDAQTIPLPRTDLPSENFLLHFLHGGEAIVATISEARDNDIEVALSGGIASQITSSDISYGSKPHIWVGLLAGKGTWHQQTVRAADAGRLVDLDWRMPFPALWRVDWSTADKLTESWEMLLQDRSGKYVMQRWFGQDESEGQRFGNEFGARDWNKPDRSRWNPVLGSFSFPCWVDNKGQGHLQPLKERRNTEGGPIHNFEGPTLIYALDRVNSPPFQTPIDSLTLVDLVRMTLGVGPCQYILDLEGQKRNSRGVATCYGRDVINAIYKEGTQLQNGPAIQEHLAATVAFIKNVRERIDEYVRFSRDMTTYLEGQKRAHPEHAPFLEDLLSLTTRLDQFFEQNKAKIHSPEFAQQNAQQFREELLAYTGKDAAEKCAARMAVFTSIGGAQDGLVASCRMIVKTMRQRSAIALALNPALKEIALEVRARTQAMLRNPTPYEAPRH
jgi:hypothetical protein